MKKNFFPLAALILICLTLASYLLESKPMPTSPMMGQQAGSFSVPSLYDKQTFSPELWKGKIVLLNVFASWCESCIAEHPLLMHMVKSGKINMLGLGWKDSPEKLRTWLKNRGNPFSAVGVDEKGKTTLALGLSGVPETFVFDKTGKVAYNAKKPLTEEDITHVILPLVEKLQYE